MLGCKELARVLLTVRDQARPFDQWHGQDVHVYRMPGPVSCGKASPAPAGADGSSGSNGLGYYSHLLDSVPPERQSVAMVLHAMLEQVISVQGLGGAVHLIC